MKQHPDAPNPDPSQGNGAHSGIIHAVPLAQPGFPGQPHSRPTPAPPILDVWGAIDILIRRWHWLLLGGVVAAAAFLLLGDYLVKPKFTSSAQLLRFETPGQRNFFEDALSAETFSALIRSPDLLREVGNKAVPAIPPERFLKMIKIEPEPDSDVIKLSLAASNPNTAVDLLNLYSTNAIAFVREYYASRARATAQDYLKKEVDQMEKDIQDLDEHFRKLHLPREVSSKLTQVGAALSALGTNPTPSTVSPAMIARQREQLDIAMLDLNNLLAKYKDIHPLVQEKRSQISDLEKSISTQTATLPPGTRIPSSDNLEQRGGTSRTGDSQFNPEADIIRMKLMALEQGRVSLLERHRQAELYAANPPGVVNILAPATLQTVKSNMRSVKIGIVAVFGGAMGVLASLLLVMLLEFTDTRLRTQDDVRRVTRLPVITSLGKLEDMDEDERTQWAFRTWTLLQGQLSPTPNHGLVCGVTSSASGEGRTTWIKMLAEAASHAGFRVLTIATKPSPSHFNGDAPAETANPEKEPEATEQPEPASEPPPKDEPHLSGALMSTVLATPDKVTDQLTGPGSPPVVHIPLPGWVWNLERRKQWREALAHWRQIDNLVILVELPPATVPEAVLLGSNLPNVLWLTRSGVAQAAATRTALETFRHARCHLVGAALNRETSTPMKKRFPRWMGLVALLMSVGISSGLAQPAQPQQTSNATTETNVPVRSLSIVAPSQRAEWQRRLTLGPGDVLTFSLYGNPELTRSEVAIAPDGRVSFLEAQDIPATGMTVDELRERLDQELGKFRRAPRTIVNPVSFKSKKYFMLGKVMTKGVYTLDRPLTVLEAIARARGFENGLVDRNVIDLADFQRSFLVRNGQRIPLNFERLFQDGDLAQNVPIEPGDYLYFAAADVREVYVVGEVRLPGPVTYTPDMSILAAISTRGGFTERAFKSRVLVIRGPLDNPRPIIVDTAEILQAKSTNFKLEPRDIIFVNYRPFIRVEELADMAATAFIQSIITSWVGVSVVKPIQ